MPSILTRVAATDLIPAILAPTRADFDLPPDVAKAAESGIPTPFTIDYQRNVAYGIVAPKGRCLLDGSAGCWTIPGPDEDDLSMSMNGTAELADGSKVAVGVIPFDLNHAGATLTGEQAIDVMANTGVQFARVRYFHTPAGIAAAGPILPGVTYGQAIRVEAAAQSGDWRALFQNIKDEGGRYRFTGSIAVNVGGLPTSDQYIPGIAAAASADVMMVGWTPARTAAGTDTNHSKAVEQFMAESKRLTEQVAAERERIGQKYSALLKNLSGVKVERGKQNRTTARAKIRQQRSAELKALREKTKAQRQSLAERRKAAVEELRKKQRTEREQFTDKVRAERQRLTEGGQSEQGQVMEGFRNRAKALQKRFEDLREQIRQEFADRSDAIKDMDADARPEARAALAEARRKKSAELRDRYTAEREALGRERAKALDEFRKQKRQERNDLTDRQRAEREKAKQGAAIMPTTITSDIRPGQTVTLLDGTIARVASLADMDGVTMLVTDDGRVVDEFDVDDEAKTAGCLYRLTAAPRIPYEAEVTWAGGRGVAGSMHKTDDGQEMVEVRRIDDAGNIARWDEAVLVPVVEVRATGRRLEYAGHEDGDGVELEGGDRLIDPQGPAATPAQVASASCGCGGKVASVEPPGNGVPSIEEPSGQLALERIDALEQQIADLAAKVDVLAKAKQEADISALDAQVAALRTVLTDVGA